MKKYFALVFVFATAMVTSVAFVNCSHGFQTQSGSGDETDNGASVGEPLQDVAVLQGNWRQEFCAPMNGSQSGNNLHTITRLNGSTITFVMDVYVYGTTNCTGAGGGAGGTTSGGNIIFVATAVDGAGKYFRGTWTTPQGHVSKAIWALKDANTLCEFSDTEPTAFPTAADITSYVNTVLPSKACYKKL